MKFFSSLSLLLVFFAFTFQVALVNAISNNPDSACSGFWNHWTHHEGSSCKFYSNGDVVDGKCHEKSRSKFLGITTVKYRCKADDPPPKSSRRRR
ncbi:hypothetical protein F5878DRAFT_409864 [Lentinula raphanica]|uniref:Uncharacterized protein n=1 Tax=Lentinula raphanica TaxID=153919 RepID=A0AA38UKU7_9AGAR|nr:hypothetical protein F5878DRAFT_409864 [Lentinula raphanica]